jgi:outer membrane protein assembly factor BamB
VPPRRVFITLASLATAVVLVRAGLLEQVVGPIIDHAVRNIITLILVFAGLLSLALWFVRESGHPRKLTRAVGWGLLGAAALAAVVFRIERVSGDLVPEIVWRWSPSRDRLLPRPEVAGDRAAGGAGAAGGPAASPSGWAATPTDFARFLGPSGSGSLAGPPLDPDWVTRPPRLLWRRPIGAGWGAFAVVGDHAVTLEQRGEEEIISCHDVATGEPRWAVAVTARHQTVLGGTGPRSTPTIHDGVVYATGATGWFHAIDGATGRVVWRINVLDDLGIDAAAHTAAVAWGRSGSPLIVDDLVVVPGGGPLAVGGGAVALVAYERRSGDRRWTAGDTQISYTTPVLADVLGRRTIVSVDEARVAGYDPHGGDTLWTFDWPGHSNSDASCSQPHVLDDTTIFVSKGYGPGAAVFRADEAGSFRPVWRAPSLLKTKFANVVMHEGHAYGLSDGILECVRLADGTRAWKGGRYGQGQVLRVGGLLLVQAESGEVVLVDCAPDAHRVRARLAALSGQTWNNLALAGRRLLVRNADEAACYELPLAADAVAARGSFRGAAR